MPPLDPVTSSFGDKVITAIQLIYGVPSVMLMILFFIFFGSSKTFEGSFYRLVQLDLLTNILCYFNTWIGIRLEKHQIGVDLLKLLESLIPGSLSFSKLLLNFFLHMQFCSSMALNLHRISSVICYKNYERNWSRCYLLYALFSILYSTLPLLWIHRFAAEVTLINGTLSASYHMDVMSDLLFLNAICSIFYFLSILALGLITAFLISKIVKGFNNVDNSLSRKLSRITLIYCTLYSGILLWSIVRSIDSYFPFLPALFTTYKLDILMFSSDAMTLSLPYILIIFDRNLAFKKPRSNPGSRLAVFVSPSTANFN